MRNAGWIGRARTAVAERHAYFEWYARILPHDLDRDVRERASAPAFGTADGALVTLAKP